MLKTYVVKSKVHEYVKGLRQRIKEKNMKILEEENNPDHHNQVEVTAINQNHDLEIEE